MLRRSPSRIARRSKSVSPGRVSQCQSTADVNVADRSVRRHMRDHVRKNHMCGFKLFPSKCRCYPDDKRMFPIYETAVELDVPLVVHAGRVPADFVGYGLNRLGAEHGGNATLAGEADQRADVAGVLHAVEQHAGFDQAGRLRGRRRGRSYRRRTAR